MSVSGLMFAQETPAFRIFGFVPWHGSVRNIILLHTHARARLTSAELH